MMGTESNGNHFKRWRDRGGTFRDVDTNRDRGQAETGRLRDTGAQSGRMERHMNFDGYTVNLP